MLDIIVPVSPRTSGCPEKPGAAQRDGRACLHNNAAERRMRPLALGRKNYLFAGSLEGGRRAAIIYTLVGTAELNGWDPQAYLRVLLDRIADHPINRIGELAPWHLAQPAERAPQAPDDKQHLARDSEKSLHASPDR